MAGGWDVRIYRVPGLYSDSEAGGDELGLHDMQFESQLDEQVVGDEVLECESLVAPSVLVGAGACGVVGVEESAVEGLSSVGGDLLVGLEVLDGVEDVEADMVADAEAADGELRLQAHAESEAVVHAALAEVGLAEEGLRCVGVGGAELVTDGGVGAIVEHVHAES